jgi:hypothetical protein
MPELAQTLVLLFLIILAIAAINGGPGGVKQWWRAKFLGKTS